MILLAPTMRAPCTTLRPMPPRPNTTTFAPGSTFAGVDHRADAGGDAAADVADLVERRVLADLRHRDLRQHGEIREGRAAHVVMDQVLPPMEKRLVPSGITPLPCVARIAVHRLVLRDRQDLHWRHSGVYSGMT